MDYSIFNLLPNVIISHSGQKKLVEETIYHVLDPFLLNCWSLSGEKKEKGLCIIAVRFYFSNEMDALTWNTVF